MALFEIYNIAFNVRISDTVIAEHVNIFQLANVNVYVRNTIFCSLKSATFLRNPVDSNFTIENSSIYSTNAFKFQQYDDPSWDLGAEFIVRMINISFSLSLKH
jgi:hypothetical protein